MITGRPYGLKPVDALREHRDHVEDSKPPWIRIQPRLRIEAARSRPREDRRTGARSSSTSVASPSMSSRAYSFGSCSMVRSSASLRLTRSARSSASRALSSGVI
jgi:hypothetical protein